MQELPRVGDLMTAAVISVDENETLDSISADMTFARIRHMPVVDAHERIVGLISQRDLAKALALGHGSRRVGEVMRRDLHTARVDTSLTDAIPDMIENKISSLPVVDAAGKLVGILTESDFLFFVYKIYTGSPYMPRWADVIKPVW